MDAKISSSFWSDPDIEKLSPEIKLAYLWLITNAQRTVCGFCQISTRRFSFETGLNADVLEKTFKALPRALKPFREENIVYVRRFIHYQLGRGEQLIKNNIYKSVVSCWRSIAHQPLKDAIASDYPEIMQGLAKGLEGLGKGLKAQREGEGEGEGEKGGVGEKPEASLFSLTEVKFCGQRIGLPDHECETLFHHYNSQGWLKGSGQRITSLDSIVAKWKTKWEADGRPTNGVNGSKSAKKMTNAEILEYALT